MQNMLNDGLKKSDFTEDAAILAKAAISLGKTSSVTKASHSLAAFLQNVKRRHASLKNLVSMRCSSSNLSDQEKHDSQACLT